MDAVGLGLDEEEGGTVAVAEKRIHEGPWAAAYELTSIH